MTHKSLIDMKAIRPQSIINAVAVGLIYVAVCISVAAIVVQVIT